MRASAANDSKVEVRHITVGYHDLNLQTESGAQELISRVSRAATRACGGKPSAKPLVFYADVEARFYTCRNHAVQSAIVTLNHPVVTAAYARQRSVDDKVVSS